MNVYLVWETHEYERWILCAIFATEEDASACAQKLNDEAHDEIMKLRREINYNNVDDSRYDRHIVNTARCHKTVDDWLSVRDAAGEEVNDGQ